MASELDKLETLLTERGIKYERKDQETTYDAFGYLESLDRHQICVPEYGKKCQWDAICQKGSYGYEKGLLEIYGCLVDEIMDGDSVVGWLTAQDVIDRVDALTRL